ncbi:MAG: serine/threonine-protein kinase, partial [Planctomycetota bacterium]
VIDPLIQMPQIPGYEGLGLLGRGSFGTVYRARQTLIGREVAIKVLPTKGRRANAEIVKRFLLEIEAMGNLDHENLVRVFGAGEGPGFAYLVMELVEGDTVSKKVREEGPLPLRTALSISRQIASALGQAFATGYIHRDVKPENVLLTTDGRVKLCDFGLVKQLGEQGSQGLTRPGQGFGSVAYMPPEQVRSARSADQRADVYSTGASLYFMLTGERPFTGKVTRGLLKRVMTEMPPTVQQLNPSVPALVSDLVQRCMQKSPDDRFHGPAELEEALTDALSRIEDDTVLKESSLELDIVDVASEAPTGAVPTPSVALTPQPIPETRPEPAAPAPPPPAVTRARPGRTLVGVPAFPGETKAPAAKAPARPGRTLVGVPAFNPDRAEAPAASFAPPVVVPAPGIDPASLVPPPAAPAITPPTTTPPTITPPKATASTGLAGLSSGQARRPGRTLVGVPAFRDDDDDDEEEEDDDNHFVEADDPVPEAEANPGRRLASRDDDDFADFAEDLAPLAPSEPAPVAAPVSRNARTEVLQAPTPEEIQAAVSRHARTEAITSPAPEEIPAPISRNARTEVLQAPDPAEIEAAVSRHARTEVVQAFPESPAPVLRSARTEVIETYDPKPAAPKGRVTGSPSKASPARTFEDDPATKDVPIAKVAAQPVPKPAPAPRASAPVPAPRASTPKPAPLSQAPAIQTPPVTQEPAPQPNPVPRGRSSSGVRGKKRRRHKKKQQLPIVRLWAKLKSLFKRS